MKSIQALREQRSALARELKDQMEKKGDQVWSAEDRKAFDDKADQIDHIDSQIASMQRVIDREAEERFDDVKNIDPKDIEGNQRKKAYDKFLRQGKDALSAEEHAMIRNTMSTTTGSQGGYTVQSEVAKELIDSLKSYRGIREVADNITTANGAPLSYPSSDGTSETGEIVAENAAAGTADISFGTVPLNTFKYGSKIITVPIELLMDSSIDIIALVNKRVRDRIGRIQNSTMTTGNGTTAPNGLITAASVGKVGGNGQTVTVTYDDLVDLVESVDVAYDNGQLKFMLSQAIRKVVRKIKDTAGRPIWTPSYDAGISGGFVDQLLGYEVTINNDLPTPAANAKSIAFGDLSRYMVRDAMEVTLFRFEDSAFMKNGQVGFLAWCRAGGNLLDTGAVKLYQHSAT